MSLQQLRFHGHHHPFFSMFRPPQSPAVQSFKLKKLNYLQLNMLTAGIYIKKDSIPFRCLLACLPACDDFVH